MLLHGGGAAERAHTPSVSRCPPTSESALPPLHHALKKRAVPLPEGGEDF